MVRKLIMIKFYVARPTFSLKSPRLSRFYPLPVNGVGLGVYRGAMHTGEREGSGVLKGLCIVQHSMMGTANTELQRIYRYSSGRFCYPSFEKIIKKKKKILLSKPIYVVLFYPHSKKKDQTPNFPVFYTIRSHLKYKKVTT